ncbi:MAG: GNAT family N-acetyltransferase [Bdellovibrionaceae bacterium]|nr:GNAT family N-acetyltransferase [Pseudobdellovibrionaceae bacterium]
MNVRKAKAEDAKGIVEAHFDAVHNTASAHYSAEILKAWHGGVTEPCIEKVKNIIQGSCEEIYVCEKDGNIIGFSSIVPEFNELRAVYVRNNFGKKGVGTKLFFALEKRAKELGLKKLQLHSSLTARDFYKQHGFRIHSDGIHTLNNGTKMACVLMSKRYDAEPIVEIVDEKNLKNCIDFLEARKETCLFLLGNMKDYGFRKGEHLSSGNYRVLKRHDKIVCVFSMTRRSNLIIQSDALDDYSPEIAEAVKEDNIEIKGIIGPWKDTWLFKSYLETSSGKFKTNFVSKEKMYSLPLVSSKSLVSSNSKIELEPNQDIRFLTLADYEQWDPLNREYLAEEGLVSPGGSEQRKSHFKERVDAKYWWGVFHGKELVSIGAYNTRYKNIGQIGGVYTPPEERRKGYSKLCIKKLIKDSVDIHKLDTLILFTGEKNYAAQSLYEVLGFKQMGYFGLIFGENEL